MWIIPQYTVDEYLDRVRSWYGLVCRVFVWLRGIYIAAASLRALSTINRCFEPQRRLMLCVETFERDSRPGEFVHSAYRGL